MCKLDLEKAEEPEIKLLTSAGPWKNQENYRKTPASLTTLKSLTVWITTNCRKFFKRWDYQVIEKEHDFPGLDQHVLLDEPAML